MTNTTIDKTEEMNENNHLPQGWVECKLSNLCFLNNGIKKANINLPYLDVKFLRGKKQIDNRTLGAVLSENDLVILVDGENSGEVFKIPIAGIMGSTFKKLEFYIPEIIDFVLYFIRSNQNLFKENKKGSAIPHLDKKLFENLEFKLPPLAEQERIVEMIEELFSDIDDGIKTLEKTKLQIKQYRQSVLKSAFDGKLYKSTSWSRTTLCEVILSLKNGLSKRSGNSGNDTVVLRLADFCDHKIKKNNLRKIKLTPKEIEQYKLQFNDLLIIRVNGSKDIVGQFIIYDKNENWIYCDHIIRMEHNKTKISSKFLFYYAQTQFVRKYINKNMVSTAGQNTINQATINNLPILLPTLTEQEKIVEEIEKRFEVADVLEQAVNEGLEKAKQLKQSILKKAFEGKLVPQNPNDEPASVLLEKIKAEKQKKKN